MALAAELTAFCITLGVPGIFIIVHWKKSFLEHAALRHQTHAIFDTYRLQEF